MVQLIKRKRYRDLTDPQRLKKRLTFGRCRFRTPDAVRAAAWGKPRLSRGGLKIQATNHRGIVTGTHLTPEILTKG